MPRWEEVLKARGNLLLWAISQVKKKGLRNSLAERAKPLVEDILQIGKKSSKFLEHLKHLNIYGLRDLMEFFQNYSWLEGRALRNGGPDDGLSRLVEHHPVGLIAYMLHRKLLYSQHNSPFPNIYLVNNKAPFIERDAVPHSYWLKSLILRYICAQAKEATDPEQIIRTFHQDGDGYSRKLIQACLGSMCIASASGLIKLHRVPVRDKRLLTISNVTVSERGRYCMDEIFDKFVYLQLIVDDYMLPVPRVVGKDLVLGGRASDYAYLVAPKADYTHKGREMIRTKARKVRLFLVVLDGAWKCEPEIWPGVMSRLKDAGVGLPNPKSMLEDVDEEFGRIAHVFPGTIAVEAVRHYSESRREEIRQARHTGFVTLSSTTTRPLSERSSSNPFATTTCTRSASRAIDSSSRTRQTSSSCYRRSRWRSVWERRGPGASARCSGAAACWAWRPDCSGPISFTSGRTRGSRRSWHAGSNDAASSSGPSATSAITATTAAGSA